jgi:hypothetical protein
MQYPRAAVPVILVLLCAAAPTDAAERPYGAWRQPQRGAEETGWFTEQERRTILDYFTRARSYPWQGRDDDRKGAGPPHKPGKGASKGLPPGLAKRESLPPGLQRQIERNGRLPPGLQKRALPRDLQARLPRRSSRYERAIVDGRVLLIDRVTDRIADIIQGIRMR